MKEREVADFLIGLMETEPEEWYKRGVRYHHKPSGIYVEETWSGRLGVYDLDHSIATTLLVHRFGWWQNRRVRRAIVDLGRQLSLLRMKKRE